MKLDQFIYESMRNSSLENMPLDQQITLAKNMQAAKFCKCGHADICHQRVDGKCDGTPLYYREGLESCYCNHFTPEDKI